MILMTIAILRRVYYSSTAAKSLSIDCGITDALDALHVRKLNHYFINVMSSVWSGRRGCEK